MVNVIDWKQFLISLNDSCTSDKIKKMRMKVGLSQTQLGEIAGCSYNVISQIENGQYLNKETRYLVAISHYFRCGLDWLIGDTKILQDKPAQKDVSLSESIQSLASAISLLYEKIPIIEDGPTIEDIDKTYLCLNEYSDLEKQDSF